MALEFGYIRCSSCGSVNRVSKEKLLSSLHCGICKKAIAPYPSALEAGDSNIEKEALNWPGTVLIDFWTPTCGYCRQMMPVVQKIAAQRAGLIKVVTVNAQASPSTAARFQIQGVPAFFLYQNGKMVNQLSGALPEHQFIQWVEKSAGF